MNGAVQPVGFVGRISSRIKRRVFERKYGRQAFLIYSMGKVGSSTIKASFEHSFPYLDVFQIHFLSDFWQKEKLLVMPVYYQVHIKWAEQFFTFRKNNPGVRLKIITLVREPIMRDVSDVFENGKEYFDVPDISKVDEEKILQRLAENDYTYTLEWFDTEFRNWTGVNIYDLPFDREKGYSVWKLKDFDLLCIKLEKLNSVITDAMKELSGFPFTISANANLAENKPEKDLYKKVVGRFRVSPEKARKVYNSGLVTHFYTPEEIAAFRERWEKK